MAQVKPTGNGASGNRARRRGLTEAAVLLLLAGAALIACSSSGDHSRSPSGSLTSRQHPGGPVVPNFGTGSASPSASTASSGGPVIPNFGGGSSGPPVDSGGMKAMTLRMHAQDGTSLTLTFVLTSAMHVGRAADAVWRGFSADPMPCSADPTRDAIFVGSALITNETPKFSADLNLPMGTVNNGRLDLGVDYSDSSQCQSLVAGPGLTDAGLAPNLDGAEWGPTPIELVLHGFYSPAEPSGDQVALAHANVEIVPGGSSGLWTLASDSRFMQVEPSKITALLRLDRLG